MTIQADRRIATERDREVNLNAVTPGFFSTLGARIVAGRDFDERDARRGRAAGPRVAIVNDAFAARYLGGRSRSARWSVIGSGPDAQPNIEIVGVVATSVIAACGKSRSRRSSRCSMRSTPAAPST